MLPFTIEIPHTYAQWAAILDELKNKTDDLAVLEAMQKGTIEWQSGVAERFAQRLIDVANHRMNMATDKFQKELNRSYGQERVIVSALLSLRKELRFLAEVMSISALPEEDRKHYRQLIVNHANQIQKSLEDSAKADHTGKLTSIIRNNRVNAL